MFDRLQRELLANNEDMLAFTKAKMKMDKKVVDVQSQFIFLILFYIEIYILKLFNNVCQNSEYILFSYYNNYILLYVTF